MSNTVDLREDAATMAKVLLPHRAKQDAELRELRKLRDTLRQLAAAAVEVPVWTA